MSKLIHNESNFEGYDGSRLYYQSWVSNPKQKASIVIVHGIAEHSGRYEQLAARLVGEGYGVYCHDLRGHGRSEGMRCNIKNFAEYSDDLAIFLDLIRQAQNGEKTFLMGHSMGGTIAVNSRAKRQGQLAGLILSGISTRPGKSVPRFLIAISDLLSMLLPNIGTTVIDSSTLSQDKAVVDSNDPLVYRKKIPARGGTELLRAMEHLPIIMPKITLPLLIMHGTCDRLAFPEGSRIIFNKAGSKDKTLNLYEGFYHEIFNEPGHERVLQDLLTWLNSH